MSHDEGCDICGGKCGLMFTINGKPVCDNCYEEYRERKRNG